MISIADTSTGRVIVPTTRYKDSRCRISCDFQSMGAGYQPAGIGGWKASARPGDSTLVKLQLPGTAGSDRRPWTRTLLQ